MDKLSRSVEPEKRDTKKIHKPHDTIENVDSQKMKDAVDLIAAVLKELD